MNKKTMIILFGVVLTIALAGALHYSSYFTNISPNSAVKKICSDTSYPKIITEYSNDTGVVGGYLVEPDRIKVADGASIIYSKEGVIVTSIAIAPVNEKNKKASDDYNQKLQLLKKNFAQGKDMSCPS